MAVGFTPKPLPAYMGAGYVSIYGAQSIYGISGRGGKPVVFGEVVQMFDNMAGLSIGQSVMFFSEDATQLEWGTPYYVIEQRKIVLIEKER